MACKRNQGSCNRSRAAGNCAKPFDHAVGKFYSELLVNLELFVRLGRQGDNYQAWSDIWGSQPVLGIQYPLYIWDVRAPPNRLCMPKILPVSYLQLTFLTVRIPRRG